MVSQKNELAASDEGLPEPECVNINKINLHIKKGDLLVQLLAHFIGDLIPVIRVYINNNMHPQFKKQLDTKVFTTFYNLR